LPLGSYLYNLGCSGLAYLANLPSASRPQRPLHLCHQLADSNDAKAFVVCQLTAKHAVNHLTDMNCNVYRPGSLPSVSRWQSPLHLCRPLVDGKEAFAVAYLAGPVAASWLTTKVFAISHG